MSVHVIYYKDGAKWMRPVLSRPEYLALRNSGEQIFNVAAVRSGDVKVKGKLLQMNYSCLPNEDGSLRGSKRAANTVGMDIDFVAPKDLKAEEQQAWVKAKMDSVPELVLSKKDELGLLMLERSASKGYHLVFRRREELSQEENLKWASELLGVEFDHGAKDITRVFFTTTADKGDLIYLSDEIFRPNSLTPSRPTPLPLPVREGSGHLQDETSKTETTNDADACSEHSAPSLTGRAGGGSSCSVDSTLPLKGERGGGLEGQGGGSALLYHHIPYATIVAAWLGDKPVEPGDRHRTSLVLADHLRYITDDDPVLIEQILRQTPFVDEIVKERGENVAATVKSAREFKMYRSIPKRMQEAIDQCLTPSHSPKDEGGGAGAETAEDEESLPSRGDLEGSLSTKKLPQGIRDSIDAVGPQLAMPVVTAVCPCIGALATGVTLDVHGQKKGLNLIAYIAGDFASGKGQIDPVVEAWMSEVKALDTMYQMQENEWRAKKRAAKNKKEQPEEPKLPVRCLTLNNTVANLAERLANTEGKHAFSFTPEADTVAQKWKSSMSDFSIMLRQSYDGTSYEREARSAEAVNVHIKRLLWNVTLCGTPDALYRVVSNYTDGFQSRIAIARTPDNTFAPLELKPYVLTDRQRDRIQQVAHLLPLMQGEVVLPKLEARGRTWLERIRLETMMNDDKVRARQRFRVCVTAQRMTCCLMLCKVCETLIQKHGLNGAETQMKQNPNLWREMLMKAQTPQMLEAYDIIADSLLENALHFFRDRIENAFNSRDYAGSIIGERQKRGRNDSIYGRLDVQFTFEQAMQHAVAVKGAGVTHNSVRQMLKNWRNQGLVEQTEDGRYRKSLTPSPSPEREGSFRPQT